MVGFLATGAYFLIPSQSTQEALRPLFTVAALGAVVAGILLHRPRRPLPWYLIASAILLFVVGIVVYVCYAFATGEEPGVSMADVFLLVSYPFAAAGLLLFQRQRLARDRASTIDPIIVSVGVGICVWVFLMQPYVTDPSLSLIERLVSVAYPLMDVLLLAVVVRMLLVSGKRPFAYYPLVAGLLCTLAFDAAYTATDLAGTYSVGSPVDAFEMLFGVLLGTAVLHPSMAELSDGVVLDPQTKLTRRRLVLLAAASLTAPGLLALQAARGEPPNVPIIVGGSVVLFLLVLARMSGIMSTREQTINRERLLRQTSAALVAVPDREDIYEVALDATRNLLGKGSNFWASVATGSPEEVTVVAETGDQTGEFVGVQIYLDEYRKDVRAGLLEGRVVEVGYLNIDASKVEALWASTPKPRGPFLLRCSLKPDSEARSSYLPIPP